MPLPGRPHLIARTIAARGSLVVRRFAPSGICVSILRPSPAHPWQAWQSPFCRKIRMPAATSSGAGAWACPPCSTIAAAANATARRAATRQAVRITRVAPFTSSLQRNPVRRIGPDDQVADIGFEVAPPVRRAAGDDDHVPGDDAAADAVVDPRGANQ